MKRACIVFAILSLGFLNAGTAAASAISLGQADNPGQANGHAKDNSGQAKGHTKDNPGKAKGHTKQHPGKSTAPGQVKKVAPASGASSGASDKSRNENKKVTYCHVPPGNPANGHLITTSVNAILPGHVNHPGDIIPPFSYIKHGKTVAFAGQNWDAAGRAALANGCDPVAAAGGTSTGTTGGSSGGQVAGTQAESGLIDELLPSAGGARLALLVIGLGLVAAGVAVLARRRDIAL